MKLTPVDLQILKLIPPKDLGWAISFSTLTNQCNWMSRRALRARLVLFVNAKFVGVSDTNDLYMTPEGIEAAKSGVL